MPNAAVNQEQTFLLNLLRATNRNQEVYPLLQQNLDKLNDDFALLLRQWATCQFTSQPDKGIIIARAIVKFSKLIQRFDEGNLASNLEIAIAGYEAALIMFTREAFPQDWANIQQDLLAVYQQRQQILYTTVAEFRQETRQTQSQINILTEQFQEKLLQTKLQIDELMNQQLLQQLQQTRQELDELKTASTKLNLAESNPVPEINLQPRISAIKEVKSPKQRFNTVILYDLENLTLGSRSPTFNFSLRGIIEQVEQIDILDKIAIQCAYADWSNYKLRDIKKDVQELGIEPIQIFGFSFQRNAADIQLTIDAIELLHSRPSLEVFVIVSGDGAFASLAKKLHEYGKTVIGCAYRNQTNRVLAAVCDHFIWIPEPEVEIRDHTINLPQPRRQNVS
jgi:uncharacterized LabA/DUF88 family protein